MSEYQFGSVQYIHTNLNRERDAVIPFHSSICSWYRVVLGNCINRANVNYKELRLTFLSRQNTNFVSSFGLVFLLRYIWTSVYRALLIPDSFSNPNCASRDDERMENEMNDEEIVGKRRSA